MAARPAIPSVRYPKEFAAGGSPERSGPASTGGGSELAIFVT
jgi:hypothetical protein